MNSFRCKRGKDSSSLSRIGLYSWGLWPKALHGVSSRIRSKDSFKNGGPSPIPLCTVNSLLTFKISHIEKKRLFINIESYNTYVTEFEFLRIESKKNVNVSLIKP